MARRVYYHLGVWKSVKNDTFSTIFDHFVTPDSGDWCPLFQTPPVYARFRAGLKMDLKNVHFRVKKGSKTGFSDISGPKPASVPNEMARMARKS